MAALPAMLEHDRRKAGWSVGRAAWELGVSIREYRELEVGTLSPTFETWDRICKLYGWPQTSRLRSVNRDTDFRLRFRLPHSGYG
jgi:predicted transcriptional regulator